MKKTFLATVLAAGVCLPVYAAQFTNDSDARYDSPFAEEEQVVALTPEHEEEVKKAERNEGDAEATAAMPIHLNADHAEYDSVSGDFHASGNVVLMQGKDKLVTTAVVGNMKTGDVWLEQGGTLVEPGSEMTGQWAHYNFNTKTGEIKEITGQGNKDYYSAPHATIYPDKMVMDKGGTLSRCPSVEHPPCLSIEAKTFEIYPKDKMVARDVKVYVRGVHVYSRDLWVSSMSGEGKTRIRPHLGYDDTDNGAYIGIDVMVPVTEKTMVGIDAKQYTDAGYKQVYKVNHDERNFSITYRHGWEEDDGDWYKKQNNWRIEYKPHHIVDGLPLTYSGYFEYGLWNRENRSTKSWHKEYAVYLNHDPIYLFNSQNTVLNMTVGKKWVNESVTDDTRSTDMYYATLAQKISPKWDTWVGYYKEKETSSLFDLDQPDMDEEMRNGVRFSPDDRNEFSIVNRYDVSKGSQYETDYRWLHKFCCWALEFTYEKEQYNDDNSFSVHYYFYNL